MKPRFYRCQKVSSHYLSGIMDGNAPGPGISYDLMPFLICMKIHNSSVHVLPACLKSELGS